MAKRSKKGKRSRGGVPKTNLGRRLAHTASGGPVVEVDDGSFGRVVDADGVPVLVDFWAPWCGPCKAMGLVIEQLAVERRGSLRVVKYNTEANNRVASDLNIRSIPTLALFRDGEVLDVKVGAMKKAALEAWIDRTIASA